MTRRLSRAQEAALDAISNANAGLIRPGDLVEAARPETSPLHSLFTWDDQIAAERLRLIQARTVIRMRIEVLDTGRVSIPVRSQVSLTTDQLAGGGYRSVRMVLANDQQRNQMLADAIAELERLKRRYATLHELVEVFAAIDNLEQAKAAEA